MENKSMENFMSERIKIDMIHTYSANIANKLNNIIPVIYITLGLSVVSIFLQGLILYIRLFN